MEEERNHHLSAQAVNALFKGIGDDVLEKIMPLEDAYEIWLKFQDIYESSNGHHHSNLGISVVSDEDNFT